ncbi:metal ABC transporter permease [Cardinium endosymbiont of Culicoides punctatus]|uniref:metal ABC transporter permease n=1 Tax=Cardinium endosymbiont of Culicoides punctatus TaxID=2304601 RepID=UPI001058A76E|nr:metal ABC transporter permease [Cardinium endosymbiont of Culicoides punctatus]TDG93067.1 Manganese transport system membrane protein MntB [Cardinium endosymbiont of Culicoides punctatus]
MEAIWTIIIAALASINCALVGTYLVLRKIAMMGDAIAHATLPGIVLALLITGSKSSPILVFGAGITGILVTFLIAFLEKNIRIQADAAIGINFTFLFAVGVILISFFSRKIDLDPECSLYGELATAPLDVLRTVGGTNLGPKSFYILLTVLIINLIFFILGYKYLFVSTFDAQFAKSIGINTTLWHYALMAITSLTTVATFEVAGAILVVSLLIVPGASMYLVTKSLKYLLFYNVIFAIIASIGGYYLSLFSNSSMAAAMVTIAGVLFLATLIFSKCKNN